jgi:hypothetical protein
VPLTPRDAVLAVLRDADEPLHWTVIQDRALRTEAIDPFEVPDVRRVRDRLTARDTGYGRYWIAENRSSFSKECWDST